MPVVFRDSPCFPLPADYGDLDLNGQRMARVNAVSLGGDPDLEVASWQFFRHYYLSPPDSGWYRDGFVESPPAHAAWVRDWYTHSRLVMACPRGACKTTINLEDILRNLVSRRYWEVALFLATREFCTDRLGRVASQIENNAHIIDDFGKLKPKKGAGTWNRGSVLETTTGCKLSAKPIKGASLGTRPSGLVVLDDVEKSRDQVINPADEREGFHRFFFNALLPMARNPASVIPMRIIGTLYSRQMFIYWLYSTDDPKVKDFFNRTLMDIYDLGWDVMGPAWIEEEKKRLGASAFSAQCLNKPSTDDEQLLRMHPQLTTYHLEDRDQAAVVKPLCSNAKIVTHQVTHLDEVTNAEGKSIIVPKIRRLSRPFADTVRGMYRFITVDYAPTINEMSDFSAVHVMGLESTSDHPNTLYSLDAWLGKVQRNELVRIMADMALKWEVYVIGVEAYPLQMEAFERFQLDTQAVLNSALAGGEAHTMPVVIPLKFPHSLSKAEKIKGMAWRFDQYRVKIPSDRGTELAYRELWNQINLFTNDLGLLQHDDILDTLAMHQQIAKGAPPIAVSVAPAEYDPEAELRKGNVYSPSGESNVDALAAVGRLTEGVWAEAEAAIEDRMNEEEQFDYDQIGYGDGSGL